MTTTLSTQASPNVDEEALAGDVRPEFRRVRGVYFTPAALVSAVLDAVTPLVPTDGKVAIIDPACGAGAFLSAAAHRFPKAKLVGLELSAEYCGVCAQRVPTAVVLEADSLFDGGRVESHIPRGAFELWIGNPPYNGTSAVLRDPARYAELRAVMGAGYALPRGASLRDDFAFFILRAAERLRSVPGALAFVTPATLLDAFIYAPLRHALLDQLRLAQVLDLGAGVFAGARVRTCVTVWTNRPGPESPGYRARPISRGPFAVNQLGPSQPLAPRSPEWLLRPVDDEAQQLEDAWRTQGEPLTTLVPISSPGLKTRFDELLVDDDRDRLIRRMRQLLQIASDRLPDFALEHALPPTTFPKLQALKVAADQTAACFDEGRVRPFFRYAGARHRRRIPVEARAFCYLDRRLIPRGDHRFRGQFDPHAGAVKLLFNVRELPLSAAVLDDEGCVHDHRHTRFAPLWVPERLLREGLGAARRPVPLGACVANLSERGLRRARILGGPRALFGAIEAFINSEPVQQVWAPAFGAIRELPVPVDTLTVE